MPNLVSKGLKPKTRDMLVASRLRRKRLPTKGTPTRNKIAANIRRARKRGRKQLAKDLHLLRSTD